MLPQATQTTLHEHDNMAPEVPREEELADGVMFKTRPYYFSGGASFVNLYTVEIQRSYSRPYGMLFSEHGDYGVDLATRCENRAGAILCAINCNFGLITDDALVRPKDIAYNLHLENGLLYQLPCADKTTLLVDKAGRLDFRFLHARGRLMIGGKWLTWAGSVSKSGSGTEPAALSVYGPFNVRLLRIADPVTGTRQICDNHTAHTPRSNTLTDICLSHDGRGLIVAKKQFGGGTYIFDHHIVLSASADSANSVRVGEYLEHAMVDNVNLADFTFGASTGAILVRDRNQSRSSIDASLVYQTFNADGRPLIADNPKFCRACIIKRPGGHVLMLADARKGVPGQEGLTIDELMDMVDSNYPDHLGFTNVDGGHAAKLLIRRAKGWDVMGNLHYKIWPSKLDEGFTWDGYRGRKLPALLYVCK